MHVNICLVQQIEQKGKHGQEGSETKWLLIIQN
jgi:hypothetical protein